MRTGRVGVLIGAGVLAAFQIGRMSAALPEVRDQLDVGLGLAGWLISAYTLVGALGALSVAEVARRLGPQRVLVAGLWLLALASAVGGLAPSVGLLLASRVVEGIGFVSVAVTAPTLIAEATSADRQRTALTVWSGYVPAGSVLGLVITPTALTTVGWRPLWVANAAVLAGYAVLVAALNRRPAHGAAPRPASPPRPLLDAAVTALRAPGPVLLALVFGAYAMQYMAVVGFLPTIYAEQDVALDVAGLLTAGVVAANLIGVLAAGPLLAAGVPRRLLMVAASAVMLGCAVLVFWPGASLAVAYPAALTLTAVGGVIPSSILAAVPLVAPDAGLVGAVNGIVIHGSNIGTLLGPPLVAEVARLAGGWQLSPVVLGAAALTAIAGALALRASDAKCRQEGSAMVAGGSARLP
jgi:MFS family permease